ncbi:MAG: type II secretion system protein GspE [Oceanospirillaceae bacterium]|uniref:type II secretion system ATPase GspE n=1 Tax=unclassified Thalassolituus TaxID=2624967 RepID=UPI000C0B3044|nr:MULTISPECIES: type II secretion system ATPase GspE [unclassified Thalassolituus]MAK89883.1 type II secretion system protein GspE [Thalassolituus sp.]MAS25466.1 type II secretion system protein GspE [Oceanospirillaceae bacterium]MAX98890.1 type II secretion system protein GspE [Oceanospirillaceae bacterium]MBL35804.1 type II secretion system protein GspE [Oceanospirillaceae bacterium]MBS51983.1 type II secretion system protein GspE [Oceanospirillaceae bacterium]|tara:strand:+ start:7078 stop:8631 length:1554 start_codon:yes stop_codon:yes gene_type:complete
MSTATDLPIADAIDISTADPDAKQPLQTSSLATRLPFGFAKRFGVLVEGKDDQITVYHKDGLQTAVILEIQRYLARPFRFEAVTPEEFERRLGLAYQSDSSETMEMVEGLGDDMDLASLADSVPETEDLLEQEGDAPIIRLINALLTEAVKENASDIHVETYEKRLVVRFRVDGVLREVVQPKRALSALLISRIKVMAKLDIAEKRIPQDGRIALRIGGREVDVRVSTMPSSFGERVVMRLLDKQAGRLSLSQLGMADRDLRAMRNIISKPHGIILVTGPTGSGKTTTLYGALSDLNDTSRNILTVEDPIEYSLPGIGQTQVNTKVEMTFAKGLRAILRQDPDVVMIGEIRDLETVEIAIQASLTGHLVLSTLHTNTAIGAVTRLQDMGVEPFLLSSSLVGVIAQRLVRVLCNDCKEAAPADEAACEVLRADPANPPTIYHAKGCEKCNQLGYRGRQGIYEIIEIDEKFKTLIHDRSGEQAMEQHARTLGPSIHQDGIRKVLGGSTTVEELLRVAKG